MSTQRDPNSYSHSFASMSENLSNSKYKKKRNLIRNVIQYSEDIDETLRM